VPDPLATIGPRVMMPQTERARPDQVVNSAGGYVFAIDDMKRALRFLIMGTAGGTYYVGEKDLTKDNTDLIRRLADGDQADELHQLVLDVSLNGRAAKQQPTLFALAALCASKRPEVRARALASIPDVCRTGTMFFTFLGYAQNFRGWGRAFKRAVARWYTEKSPEDLAWQVTKYRQREGWTHRDVLRLAKPKGVTGERANVLDFVCHPDADTMKGPVPDVINAFLVAQASTSPVKLATLVAKHHLSWEQLPDTALAMPEVWDAMIPTLGITALVRQLVRLASMGYTKPFSDGAREVVKRLTDTYAISRSRIHPMTVLLGSATYRSGHGVKGSLSWTPNPDVMVALEAMFYAAFGNVEPAGKRTLLGLDVSGSMGSSFAGTVMSCVEVEMALAMVTMRSEPEVFPMAFSSGFVPLPLTKLSTLGEAVGMAQGMPFERTDCAVPMMWASRNKVAVDTFLISTDNETWHGSVHPFQALQRYRDIMGIPARLAIVAMTSTGFSIAPPDDAGCLDLVGMDTSTPAILTEFSAGRL